MFVTTNQRSAKISVNQSEMSIHLVPRELCLASKPHLSQPGRDQTVSDIFQLCQPIRYQYCIISTNQKRVFYHVNQSELSIYLSPCSILGTPTRNICIDLTFFSALITGISSTSPTFTDPCSSVPQSPVNILTLFEDELLKNKYLKAFISFLWKFREKNLLFF